MILPKNFLIDHLTRMQDSWNTLLKSIINNVGPQEGNNLYPSADVLIRQAQYILDVLKDVICEADVFKLEEITVLGLRRRTLSLLQGQDLYTVGDLTRCSEPWLLAIPGFGDECLNDVKERLTLNRQSLAAAPHGWKSPT